MARHLKWTATATAIHNQRQKQVRKTEKKLKKYQKNKLNFKKSITSAS